MFITHTTNDEVIVCTPETEPETLKLYFEEGCRIVEEYDREIHNDEAVVITSTLTIN